MSAEDLDRLRDLLLADPAQAASLVAMTDETDFIASILDRAQARGLDVEPDDLREAMRRGERRWVERWV